MPQPGHPAIARRLVLLRCREVVAVMNSPEHLADPLQLLARRAGQYDTFLSLVQRGQKRALAPAALLAPMSLVGPARRSPSCQDKKG